MIENIPAQFFGWNDFTSNCIFSISNFWYKLLSMHASVRRPNSCGAMAQNQKSCAWSAHVTLGMTVFTLYSIRSIHNNLYRKPLGQKIFKQKTRKKQKKYKLWSTTLGMAIKTKHRIFRALFIKKIVEIETTNLKINLSFKFKKGFYTKKAYLFPPIQL